MTVEEAKCLTKGDYVIYNCLKYKEKYRDKYKEKVIAFYNKVNHLGGN